jgi:hypothetical protein
LLLQVCSEFLNTVILREPVPHAISIMAEVKYRYVRQMATKHNIHSWQPTAWNVTWWEALGPALVGNYATRTLLGRESLCRSAANMGKQQLDEALDSLLSFDMVMTLGRSTDIDLVITTLLGWPARNFSSQPGARVREVSVDLATKGEVAVGDSKAAKGGVAASRHLLQIEDSSSSSDDSEEGVSTTGRSLLAAPQHTNGMHKGHGGKQKGQRGKKGRGPLAHKGKAHHKGGAAAHPARKPQAAISDQAKKQQNTHAVAAAAAASSTTAATPASQGTTSTSTGKDASAAPVTMTGLALNMTAKQLEQQAAVMLVSTTWHERQAEVLDVLDKAAVWAVTGEPNIMHTGQRSKHGAHLVEVHFKNRKGLTEVETWHSFPRHTFAFLAADVEKLERLTQLDMEVYLTADLMFNLDTAWLQAMLSSPHYRKKLRAVAATQTSCGFAGMIPLDPNLLKETQAEV